MAAVGLSPHFPLLQVKPGLHRENSERHQAVLFYVHSKKLLSLLSLKLGRHLTQRAVRSFLLQLQIKISGGYATCCA